ncbi:hypothetical protein MCOR03_004770 [Pyricularia oryzae]|nr:hypothetical protein MCOR03_004770 [Pyricularia oryzae]
MDIQILTCCGICAPSEEAERQPLLPEYDDETAMQAALHQKLHTYQMLRALTKGYMPSNDQAIVNLRTLLASELLNPPADDGDLSGSGRAVLHYSKQTISHLMELLQHKNADDQIQDFVWYLSQARMSVDMEDIVERAGRAQARANTAAAYSSLKTVGSLLLTNSDFRMFLSDLGTIGKEVFSDTAMKLSSVSKDVAKQIEPSAEEQQTLKKESELDKTNGKPSASDDNASSEDKPSKENLESEVASVTKAVANGATEVVGEAQHSLVDHLQGDEKDALLNRLRRTVANLRQRTDYSDSVSTLSLLLKRYATVYSHVVEDTLRAADEDVSVNRETDKALRNFWSLIRSFGDAKEWDELEKRFKVVYEHGRSDPEFDELVRQIGNAVQELLADPSFFEHAEERFQTLRGQSKQLATRSALRDDVDALLAQLQSTVQSVLRDADVSRLLTTAGKVLKLLSPKNQYVNTDLITDCINVFVPMMVQGIQYVPIPRLEVSTPDVDLLLENLILEPGRTVNGSSFLPYKLRVETKNDLEIRKTRLNRTASAVQSIVTIKLDGLSIAAKDVGFWLRVHSGLMRFSDEGIASFSLDERGIDVHIEVEVGKERLEKMLTLRSVRVVIHQLDYTLRKSKFALGAWAMKPFILPLMKKTLELQIATAVSDSLQAANRELLFARERLRATRVADPDSLWTFVKAVGARLAPEDDPDLDVRVGVTEPGKGVFKGVYAPGSLVKLWNEEAARAKDRIREQSGDGWRNDIFDVQTVPTMGDTPGLLG